MDAGPGTWRNLVRFADFRSLSGILLSHSHPDHTTDVFMGYHARLFSGREPLAPIPLWGPQETLERVAAFAPKIGEALELRPCAPGVASDLAGGRVAFFEMAHPVPTLGMRVEAEGAVLAYSGDTGPAGDVHSLAKDADVFICEATLQASDGPWEGHMLASQAGRAAVEAGAKKLVLTHLPPERDARLSLFEAQDEAGGTEVLLAQDGAYVGVGR